MEWTLNLAGPSLFNDIAPSAFLSTGDDVMTNGPVPHDCDRRSVSGADYEVANLFGQDWNNSIKFSSQSCWHFHSCWPQMTFYWKMNADTTSWAMKASWIVENAAYIT